MNIEFMRQYYRCMYENPQGVAVENSNMYSQKQSLRYEKEENFIKHLKGLAPELSQKFEDYLDAYSDEMEIVLEEMYLLGAKDREKMLQI